eukprot:4827992-Pyramimonas_sp.AAC.1
MAHGDLRRQGVEVLGEVYSAWASRAWGELKIVTQFKRARGLQGGTPMVFQSTSVRTFLATKSTTSAFPGRAIQL